VPERTPEEIQREIEQARDALALAVDELAVRAHPKRLVDDAKQKVDEAKQKVIAKAQSPEGRAVIGGVGVLFVIVVIRRIRKRPVETPPLRLPMGVYQVS
jgi:Protein of unknown function (DUF3618)